MQDCFYGYDYVDGNENNNDDNDDTGILKYTEHQKKRKFWDNFK